MKKIKAITVNVANAQTKAEGYTSYIEQRDERGNVLLEDQYYEDGSLARRVERSFDDQDRILTESFYSGEGPADQVHYYQFNESGKIAVVKSVYSDGAVGLKRLVYGEAKRAETITMEDEQGNVESKEYRRYDAEGKVLEEALYEGSDELQQKTESSYDDHGRPISRHITYGDGYQSQRLFDYEFDESGRIAAVKVENEKGEELHYEEFEYDEDNHISEHYVESAERKQVVIRKYEYDEEGRVVKEQRLNAEDQVEEEILYQYNETGQLSVKETNTPQSFMVEMYHYAFFD